MDSAQRLRVALAVIEALGDHDEEAEGILDRLFRKAQEGQAKTYRLLRRIDREVRRG